VFYFVTILEGAVFMGGKMSRAQDNKSKTGIAAL